jgi:uncharacterized membrane protein
MNPRVVNTGNGWQWMVDGFTIFRKAAPMWIAMTLLLTVMWLIMLMVPFLGPLVFNLFSPVFFAGILIGCRVVENGEPLKMELLFAGFKSNVSALVTVGGIYLAGTIIIIGIVLIAVGTSAFTLMKPGNQPDLDTTMMLMRDMSIALLIALLLYVPLMMAIWFAPALIVFENLGAVDALKQSFAACLINTLPFLVYGLVVGLLWIVASIPLFLGLLILLPVIFCSVYTSYKDIFASPSEALSKPGTTLLK